MSKKNSENVFSQVTKIFFDGLKYYFMNFEKFFKYMAFPIFGQIIGIALIFAASFVFTLHVSTLTTKSPIFDNIPVVFLMLGLLTLPGFFIFCKAFWEYLVAMAALNSMASTLIEGGKLEDLGLHAELIKRRSLSYVFFLLIISAIYSFLSFPLLWGLLLIVFVFLALAFQVFALEEERSAINATITAINYIKGNFTKTALLLIILAIFTYWLVPGLICWGFETGNLTGFFSYPVEQYIKLLPLNELNALISQNPLPVGHFELKSYEIAKFIVSSVVATVVVAFALPLRSICCTILYKDINKRNYAGKIAAEKLAQRAQRNDSGKNSSKRGKKNIEDDED